MWTFPIYNGVGKGSLSIVISPTFKKWFYLSQLNSEDYFYFSEYLKVLDMFICNCPHFLHAIPLFIWVTVNACCNKIDPKVCASELDPSWPLLHSWVLEGARPCSTYHVSKRSHSLSRLLRYKWNTYNNVCYFRLLIAKSSATHLWSHRDTLSWASYELFILNVWLSAHHSAYRYWVPCTLHFACFLFFFLCIKRLSELEWYYWTDC